MGKVKGYYQEIEDHSEEPTAWDYISMQLDSAEKILKLITNNSNPTYLKKLVDEYFERKVI